MMTSIKNWLKRLCARKTWTASVSYDKDVEHVVTGYWRNGIYHVCMHKTIDKYSKPSEIEEVSKELRSDKYEKVIYEGQHYEIGVDRS
jgi:hypothetical protein